MRTIGLLGATALLMASVGAARAQSPQVPDYGQATTAAAVPGGPRDSVAQSRPLFSIGKLEVHIWAPMEPYYDADGNRTAAANPIWGSAE